LGYSIAAAETIRLPVILSCTCTGPYRVDTADPLTVRVPPVALVPEVLPAVPEPVAGAVTVVPSGCSPALSAPAAWPRLVG
jgi:hypothetical protein